MSHNITVEGGKSVRLPTAGKYCDRDIVITAEDLDSVLAEQDSIIEQIQAAVDNLPEAGESGGSGNASYDTCTISITIGDGWLHGYCATCFDGEGITYKYNFLSSNLGNITITDVICGSPLSIVYRVGNGNMLHQNLTLVNAAYNCAIFIAPNQAEAVATIQIGQAGGGAD